MWRLNIVKNVTSDDERWEKQLSGADAWLLDSTSLPAQHFAHAYCLPVPLGGSTESAVFVFHQRKAKDTYEELVPEAYPEGWLIRWCHCPRRGRREFINADTGCWWEGRQLILTGCWPWWDFYSETFIGLGEWMHLYTFRFREFLTEIS